MVNALEIVMLYQDHFVFEEGDARELQPSWLFLISRRWVSWVMTWSRVAVRANGWSSQLSWMRSRDHGSGDGKCCYRGHLSQGQGLFWHFKGTQWFFLGLLMNQFTHFTTKIGPTQQFAISSTFLPKQPSFLTPPSFSPHLLSSSIHALILLPSPNNWYQQHQIPYQTHPIFVNFRILKQLCSGSLAISFYFIIWLDHFSTDSFFYYKFSWTTQIHSAYRP